MLWDSALGGEGIGLLEKQSQPGLRGGARRPEGEMWLGLGGGESVRLAWELDVALPEMLYCLSCLMSPPGWLLWKGNDHLQPCSNQMRRPHQHPPRNSGVHVSSHPAFFFLMASKLWVPPRDVQKGPPPHPCSSAWRAQTFPTSGSSLTRSLGYWNCLTVLCKALSGK